MQNQSHTTVHARPDGKIAAEQKQSRQITSAQNQVLKHAADKRRRRRDLVLDIPEGTFEAQFAGSLETEREAEGSEADGQEKDVDGSEGSFFG